MKSKKKTKKSSKKESNLPGNKKANTFEAEWRKTFIQGLMLDGCPTAEIVRFCSEKYNISRRQVEKYIQQINQRFKESSMIDRDTEFAKALKRMTRLYNKCLKKGDLKSAIIASREKHELLGLKKYRFEHTGADGGPLEVKHLSDEELENRYKDLLEKKLSKKK